MRQPEPPENPEQREVIPPELHDLRKDLEAGQQPKTSPRIMLGWFNAFRRGPNVVGRVRRALRLAGLETVPDFEGAYMDDTAMRFRLLEPPPAPAEPATKPGKGKTPKAQPDQADPAKGQPGKGDTGKGDTGKGNTGKGQGKHRPGRGDSGGNEPHKPKPRTNHHAKPREAVEPTFKLAKLPAANHPPLTASPTEAIQTAVTRMLQNDYSQLPVVRRNTLQGLLSWRSIGHRYSLGLEGNQVRDFMDTEVVALSSEDSIFKAIGLIVTHECILVRKADGKLGGILTNADLGLKLGELGEPFLLIGEIEACLRNMLDAHFGPRDFRKMVHFRDDKRSLTATSAADLTFGEYLHGMKANWEAMKLTRIDRTEFIETLFAVKRIRNEVMHFDPDGLTPQDMAVLRKTVAFFQNLRAIGYLNF